MPRNLLAYGSRWLAQKQAAFTACDIEYRRGEAVIVLRAVRGRTANPDINGGPGSLDAATDDWLIEACDLAVDGEQIEPERGDTITDSSGLAPAMFEVLPIPGGDCWRYSDPHRIRYRIHTRPIVTSNV